MCQSTFTNVDRSCFTLPERDCDVWTLLDETDYLLNATTGDKAAPLLQSGLTYKAAADRKLNSKEFSHQKGRDSVSVSAALIRLRKIFTKLLKRIALGLLLLRLCGLHFVPRRGAILRLRVAGANLLGVFDLLHHLVARVDGRA